MCNRPDCHCLDKSSDLWEDMVEEYFDSREGLDYASEILWDIYYSYITLTDKVQQRKIIDKIDDAVSRRKVGIMNQLTYFATVLTMVQNSLKPPPEEKDDLPTREDELIDNDRLQSNVSR